MVSYSLRMKAVANTPSSNFILPMVFSLPAAFTEKRIAILSTPVGAVKVSVVKPAVVEIAVANTEELLAPA